jgi:LuxR family maltose regulon positive regulatory protein
MNTALEKLRILEEKSAATHHANLLLWWRTLSPMLLCAEERFEEALTELSEAIHQARTSNSDGELIRLLALQAVALDALGDRGSAHAKLSEALALGAPAGYIRRWLDAGPRLIPLLKYLRDTGQISQDYHFYLDSLLESFNDTFDVSALPQPAEQVNPLTPRELEIIRLICDGYSNPEIASELVVTLNTIKKHTSNIYDKLGVRSRTQAIARARQLNLL